MGTGAPLDYGDRRMWLCQPGNDPDECDRNLDATELLAGGTRMIVPHVKVVSPAYDCFYVYPTVKPTSAGSMTDFANYQRRYIVKRVSCPERAARRLLAVAPIPSHSVSPTFATHSNSTWSTSRALRCSRCTHLASTPNQVVAASSVW